MSDNHRTRTITWDDPMPGARQAQQLSGMAYFERWMNGEIPVPPISKLIGMQVHEIEEGRAVFGIDPAEYHYNPIGSVHGGIAATLLDSAMGCAIHSTLPAGTGYTTVELHINYLRPITVETGPVRCEGKIIHVGRRLATAEAKVSDESGKLYAHGSTTCMVFQV